VEIQPDLTLCTVAGSDSQPLARLFRSLEDTADPVSVEIVVAETEPGAATGLADEVPGLLVLHAPGLTRLAALNRAIRHGQGRYTLVLDPEVLLLPGCLKRLIDYMDESPDVGLAVPRIVNGAGVTEPSAARFPGPSAMLLGSAWPTLRDIPTQTGEIDWSDGGMYLLRRECLEEIGPLDESLPVWAELDLYRRAQQQGWHSSYVTEAVAMHTNPGCRLALQRPGVCERLRCLKKRWLP